MIAEHCRVALRLAATLTHVAPFLRAEVSERGRTLLRVFAGVEGSSDGGCDGDDVETVSPCQFRRGVVDAMRRPEHWGMVVPGLIDPHALQVSIDASRMGATRSGVMHRVDVGNGCQLWLFAVPIDAELAHASGSELVDESSGALCCVDAFGVRGDTGTGASVAYARTTAAPGSAEEGELLELLDTLLARWSVRGLLGAQASEAGRSGLT